LKFCCMFIIPVFLHNEISIFLNFNRVWLFSTINLPVKGVLVFYQWIQRRITRKSIDVWTNEKCLYVVYILQLLWYDVTKKFKYGEKTIKLSIHFFTDTLPKDSDSKTAWEEGYIYVVANKSRELKPDTVFFKSLEEFMPKMNQLLEKNNIKLRKVWIHYITKLCFEISLVNWYYFAWIYLTLHEIHLSCLCNLTAKISKNTLLFTSEKKSKRWVHRILVHPLSFHGAERTLNFHITSFIGPPHTGHELFQ